MTTYAVTGATGGLGGAAVHALLARDIAPRDIVAIGRDHAKAEPLIAAGVEFRPADYDDRDSLTPALAGVDRLLMISGSAVGSRTPQHANVIDAATDAGVELLAYTSILRADSSPLLLADEHRQTEALLAESGIPHILLRNGWYWENYARSAPAALGSGILYGSADGALVAGAARADYAEAAAIALLTSPAGTVLELAGDQHLDYPTIAKTIGEVGGQPVRYTDLSESDYATALVAAGIPEPMAHVLADSDSGAAAGALDSTATTLVELLGRPATPLRTVLAA